MEYRDMTVDELRSAIERGESNFDGVRLPEGADLSWINLKEIGRSLSFKNAVLIKTNWEKVVFSDFIKKIYVDFQNANLLGANLQKADLRRANLQKANLQEAHLGEANLQEADLREANLQEAGRYGIQIPRNARLLYAQAGRYGIQIPRNARLLYAH